MLDEAKHRPTQPLLPAFQARHAGAINAELCGHSFLGPPQPAPQRPEIEIMRHEKRCALRTLICQVEMHTDIVHNARHDL